MLDKQALFAAAALLLLFFGLAMSAAMRWARQRGYVEGCTAGALEERMRWEDWIRSVLHTAPSRVDLRKGLASSVVVMEEASGYNDR